MKRMHPTTRAAQRCSRRRLDVLISAAMQSDPPGTATILALGPLTNDAAAVAITAHPHDFRESVGRVAVQCRPLEGEREHRPRCVATPHAPTSAHSHTTSTALHTLSPVRVCLGVPGELQQPRSLCAEFTCTAKRRACWSLSRLRHDDAFRMSTS
jgi:hypothetical protein